MKTISLIAATFLTLALSGPAADAGRIPLNGTMEAVESLQPLDPSDPSLGFFANASGTATTERLGQLLLFDDGIVDVAINAGPGSIRLIDTNGDSIYAVYWGQVLYRIPTGTFALSLRQPLSPERAGTLTLQAASPWTKWRTSLPASPPVPSTAPSS